MIDDLDIFFNEVEFTVSLIKPGGDIIYVLRDELDQLDEQVNVSFSTTKVTGKTTDLISLSRGNSVTLDGSSYTVTKEAVRIDDGSIAEVYLKET